MSKHTPGPWKLELHEGEYLISGVTEGHEHFTAIAQHKANADLIAAAPDLLEACATVLGLLPDFEGGPASTVANILEHAIAKAEGSAS